jgi:hypothetical protein
MSGGSLIMGSVASPIPTSSTATLVLASTSTANPYGIVINDGGTLIAQGASRDISSTLLWDASVNDTVITVKSAGEIEGWNLGDTITVGKNQKNSAQETEKKWIAGISGNQITLNGQLAFNHPSSATISNLTRNVVITGATGYILNLNQTAPANFNLDYVEISYMGRGVTNKWGVTFSTNARGTIDFSSIHEGYAGLYLQNSSTNSFTNNLIYGLWEGFI